MSVWAPSPGGLQIALLMPLLAVQVRRPQRQPQTSTGILPPWRTVLESPFSAADRHTFGLWCQTVSTELVLGRRMLSYIDTEGSLPWDPAALLHRPEANSGPDTREKQHRGIRQNSSDPNEPGAVVSSPHFPGTAKGTAVLSVAFRRGGGCLLPFQSVPERQESPHAHSGKACQCGEEFLWERKPHLAELQNQP